MYTSNGSSVNSFLELCIGSPRPYIKGWKVFKPPPPPKKKKIIIKKFQELQIFLTLSSQGMNVFLLLFLGIFLEFVKFLVFDFGLVHFTPRPFILYISCTVVQQLLLPWVTEWYSLVMCMVLSMTVSLSLSHIKQMEYQFTHCLQYTFVSLLVWVSKAVQDQCLHSFTNINKVKNRYKLDDQQKSTVHKLAKY